MYVCNINITTYQKDEKLKHKHRKERKEEIDKLGA